MKLMLRVVCFLSVCWLCAMPVATRAAEGNPSVDFTFEDVSIDAFVKLIGAMTGRRFVLGDDIEGTITVVSPRVDEDEIYPLFLTILESAGYTVEFADGVHRLISIKNRTGQLAPLLVDRASVSGQGLFTKVFRLEHVSASDVERALASEGERVGVRAIDETNHLVVTDTATAIARIAELIRQIDLPGMAKVTEVVPLQFAAAEELAQQLNIALSEEMSRAQALVKRLPAGQNASRRTRQAIVVAVPQSNRLILSGTAAQVDALKALIKEMDVDVPSGQGRLHAIFLRHLSAEEAAENLSALLARRQEKVAAESSDSRLISIQANVSNNALLIDASPGDFEVVKALVDRLDQSPEQVHIGVMILEVSDGDGLQLGVDFAALDSPSSVGDSVVQGAFSLGDASGLLSAVQEGVFPRGMSVGVAQGSSVNAEGEVQFGFPGLLNIDAFRSNSRFTILSETSLQSQNNQEATVSVVNEIPILKSEIQGGSGTARDVIQNIERMDVGIKLEITPHFIPGGRIRMVLNPSIEAVVDSGPDGTPFTPTIAKREVQTTVTVDDGRTIVIAGLTRRDERESERKVPILGSIPLLGWLFTRTEMLSERKDVLILVTPTVVTSTEAGNRYRESWESKTGLSPDAEE